MKTAECNKISQVFFSGPGCKIKNPMSDRPIMTADIFSKLECSVFMMKRKSFQSKIIIPDLSLESDRYKITGMLPTIRF